MCAPSRGDVKISAGGPCSRMRPRVEKAHAVGDVACEAHLVRRDDHRHPTGRELADHLEHLGDQLGVERARHLVEEHQLGLHGERPHDRDALLLPAREPVGILGRACRRGRTVRAAPSRARRPRAVERPSTSRRASVTLRSTRHVREQVVGLEDDADPAPHRVHVRRARVISTPPSKIRPASIGSSRLMQRSSVDLPEPGGADQRDHLVLGDGQLDAAQHLVAPERLREPLDERASLTMSLRRPGAVAGRGRSASP